MKVSRNTLLATILLLVIVIVTGWYSYVRQYQSAIKVGVMHSKTGVMAFSELGMIDAVQFAIDEINAGGGLLGRQVETVVVDGKSSPDVFAQAAETLIDEHKVDVVFGCWTSSCRKSVLPVFEARNHLLYYPMQYEGMEYSDNIIYLGAVPNQQMIPALEWSFSMFGKQVYLVGSEYVFPRAANEVIKDQIYEWRGDVVGEAYVHLDDNQFDSVVSDIKRAKPDVIFNTLNGEGNVAFFRALRAAGISPRDIPTMSFSITEAELARFKGIDMKGDYLVWNYLQDLDNEENQVFLQAFRSRFGADRIVGASMLMAYMGVKLWAKAVERAGTSDVEAVRGAATGISIHSPGGMFYVEDKTHHTWRTMHIGRINDKFRLQSVWYSKVPIAPKPYPDTRSVEQWSDFLNQLQTMWGGRWAPQDASAHQ